MQSDALSGSPVDLLFSSAVEKFEEGLWAPSNQHERQPIFALEGVRVSIIYVPTKALFGRTSHLTFLVQWSNFITAQGPFFKTINSYRVFYTQ